MRPVSGVVLTVAAALTSPALLAAATGTMPLDVALTRYLLAAGLCWVLLSAASDWLWPEPASVPAPEPVPAPVDPVPEPVPDPLSDPA